MPNLSIHQPLPPVAPITAPLSSATSGTSIPPLMMPAPLVPSVSTSSLPNGTASLIQPLSIPYSSSSKCPVSQRCEEETAVCCSEMSSFVELPGTNRFPLLSAPALPHASSYSLMMGGFGGASIQKAQSLIDLGSSRYEDLTHSCLLSVWILIS